MSLHRYIHQIVEIIYLDKNKKITQRKIKITGIDDGIVKAYCLMQKGPRVFAVSNILAIRPVSKIPAG